MSRFFSIVAIIFLFLFTDLLQAQSTDFQIANRMMQQQNYEDALPILEQLYNENPDANIFFDRYIDCLVNLKEYEEAIALIEERIANGYNSNQLMIKKGEILHANGSAEDAYEIWDQVIETNGRSMQLYYQIGNTLMNRREYSRAAELYKQAREAFNDGTLFINEVASAQMQAGNFSDAMSEYIRLIRNNPNQMNFVQQRLLRMGDTDLYEIAALEIEDYIVELDIAHTAYNQIHQLYAWLLIETEQYRRALIAARQYESRTEVLNYSLYALANQLLSNNEFELAAEAYRYYTDSLNQNVRNQARDREAYVYHTWADYLSDHNLEDLQLRNQLYQKSYQLGSELLLDSPSYNQRERVIVRLAELSLDVLYDRDKVSQWIQQLEQESESDEANLYYLRGRLALLDQNYTEARQQFSRANRQTDESELTEKSRYFLSLTDFFSGDFEYALLQLRSLERRNESFYANNALKLRMWIQQGDHSDTTGTVLNEYSDIIELLYNGNTEAAFNKYLNFVDSYNNPLVHNGIIELSTHSDLRYIPKLYTLIKSINDSNRSTPLRERLLWEQATMARIIVEAGGGEELNGVFYDLRIDEDMTEQFELNMNIPESDDWLLTPEDVENLYEKLILEFPQGFYAPYAREILQQTAQLSS
jgi:hypothetical protein